MCFLTGVFYLFNFSNVWYNICNFDQFCIPPYFMWLSVDNLMWQNNKKTKKYCWHIRNCKKWQQVNMKYFRHCCGPKFISIPVRQTRRWSDWVYSRSNLNSVVTLCFSHADIANPPDNPEEAYTLNRWLVLRDAVPPACQLMHHKT